MGGAVDTAILNGTESAYPDLHGLAEQVELEKAQQTMVKIVCLHDYEFSDIDGRKYIVQREWNVAPEQFRFEFADAEQPPPPPAVIGYVNTSPGVLLNGRDRPTTSGEIIRLLARGDHLNLEPGWSVEANGFTWVHVLAVNDVAVTGALYVADKFLSATDPN